MSYMVKGFARTHKEDMPELHTKIRELHAEGLTISEMAKRLNRHHTTIIVQMKRLNIPLKGVNTTSSRAHAGQPMKLSPTEHLGDDGEGGKRVYGRNYRQISGEKMRSESGL